MFTLGKMDSTVADEFVNNNSGAILGSLSADGKRRVRTEATGEELERQIIAFAMLAGEGAKREKIAVLQELLPCIHRGSKRDVCCDSPPLWICRKLKQDCTLKVADKMRLHAMVDTPESNSLAACESCQHRESATERRTVEIDIKTIAIVIPCHNYAEFLEECLASVFAQTAPPTQIIVVDDSSTDDPKTICDKYPKVQYERVELRDVHKTRQHGLQFVESTFVCFLDADDRLPPRYLENALTLFAENRTVAIAYPQLEYFGEATGPAHGTERAPQELRADDIEQRNWVSAGSVLRSELVRQSLVFRRQIDPQKSWTQDWHVAKAILRSGNWIARKMQEQLLYRKHGSNMSARPNHSYWEDADFSNEPVTIIIAFSGRWECWERLLAWLKTQTWPVGQVRLLIMNATHAPLTAKMLGLEDWQGDLQIERIDAGYPRLADKDRRNVVKIGRDVEAAVGAIYNRAITLLGTEYVVFIEDDVIPMDRNLIEKFFQSMGPWVSGVSGVYRQRYQADRCCAFDVPYLGNESFKSIHGTGIEKVGGTGFGCLMTRRSLLRRFPLSGDGPDKYFDVAFGAACGRADNGWWQWLLNRDIRADHMLNDGLTAPERPTSQSRATEEQLAVRERRPLTGYDIDGVVTEGFVPKPGDVVISGRTFAEYDQEAKRASQICPVYIRGAGRFGDDADAGSFKAMMIQRLGVTKFYEDCETQIEIIKRINPNVEIVHVGKSSGASSTIAPIAFDYGGTLRVTDGIPALREMVGRLNQANIPVVIISAISVGYPTSGIEQEIRELTDSRGASLKFDAVRFVYYPHPFTEQDIYEAGEKKADVMKELGASLIYDDSDHVCRAVRDKNLLAVRVSSPSNK